MPGNVENKEFAVLLGRAFLAELGAGRTESAIAFGRAFLLSLGMKGPEETSSGKHGAARPRAHDLALA